MASGQLFLLNAIYLDHVSLVYYSRHTESWSIAGKSPIDGTVSVLGLV